MEIIFGTVTEKQTTQAADIMQKVAALEDTIEVLQKEISAFASERQTKINLCHDEKGNLKAKLSTLRQAGFK